MAEEKEKQSEDVKQSQEAQETKRDKEVKETKEAKTAKKWSSEIKKLGDKIIALTLMQAKELGVVELT